MNTPGTYTSFFDFRIVAEGDLRAVLTAVREFLDEREDSAAERAPNPADIFFFDHRTGRQVDFDLRGTVGDVLSRLVPDTGSPAGGPAGSISGGLSATRRPGKGRPRLGVVAGEVTLLPRHWQWLASRPTSASGTLRRLIDEAIAREANDPKRRAEVLGTILWSLAGNLEGFEEATRRLHRLDFEGLFAITDAWPGDMPGFVRHWFEGLPRT